MGLDSFKSDDSKTEEDEQTSSDSQNSTNNQSESGGVSETPTQSIQEKDMNFYGTGDGNPDTRPMERKGAMSNHTVSDLAKTVDSEIVFEEDNIKLHLPIFTIITKDDEYSEGSRYQLKHSSDTPRASWNGKVVVCMGTIESRLGSVNKETVMFEAGSTSKKRVMNSLNSDLGEDLNSDSTIHINFFGDVFFMRDLAQANEEFRADDLINRQDIIDKTIQPKILRVQLEQKEEE